MILFSLSNNLANLIVAEIFSAIAFGLKDVSDLSLLNESIPESKQKSSIFAKITGKSLSTHFYLEAFSLMISGILFSINGYLPIIVSLMIVLVSLVLSLKLIEPLEESKEKITQDTLADIKHAFRFIFQSKRLRSLIFFSAIMSSFICILVNYQVSVLEELNFPTVVIGLVFALIEIVGGIFSREHESFHMLFKNKSLSILAFISVLVCFLIGVSTHFLKQRGIVLFIICIALIIKYIFAGIYQILIDKYYRNFTNEKIDTKVFSTKLFFEGIANVLLGFFASYLLNRMSTGDAFIILGITFFILFALAIIYMKPHLGLEPKKYPKGEIYTYRRSKKQA